MGIIIETCMNIVTTPARIRSRYGIREGSKIEFIEAEDGIHLIPLKSLRELRGAFKEHEQTMSIAIRELGREHREEADMSSQYSQKSD